MAAELSASPVARMSLSPPEATAPAAADLLSVQMTSFLKGPPLVFALKQKGIKGLCEGLLIRFPLVNGRMKCDIMVMEPKRSTSPS